MTLAQVEYASGKAFRADGLPATMSPQSSSPCSTHQARSAAQWI